MATELRLTGGKAVAALLVLVGAAAWHYLSARASLDNQGAEATKRTLVAEYQRYHLARPALGEEEKAGILLSLESLALVELSARGGAEALIARVEIAPHPALPPGAETVRYFRMRYRTLTGWAPPGPARASSYYL